MGNIVLPQQPWGETPRWHCPGPDRFDRSQAGRARVSDVQHDPTEPNDLQRKARVRAAARYTKILFPKCRLAEAGLSVGCPQAWQKTTRTVSCLTNASWECRLSMHLHYSPRDHVEFLLKASCRLKTRERCRLCLTVLYIYIHTHAIWVHNSTYAVSDCMYLSARLCPWASPFP